MQLIRRRPHFLLAAIAIAVLCLAACFDKGSYKGGGRISSGAKQAADAGNPQQSSATDVEADDDDDDDDDTVPASASSNTLE